MQFKDYYETLGVSPSANDAEVKAAYRKLARKYHPDVSKEPQAEERFKAVNEAYEALRDAEKRRAYDQLRAQGFRPGEEFRPPPDFGSGFHFEFDEGAAGGSGFSDFFESLFGRARREAPRARKEAEKARIEVDLDIVYTGGTQRVSVRGKLLEVRIPKGIGEGQHIRLAGQGQRGGDLLLEIGYRRHPDFAVEGRDVTYRLPLQPWEAGLGTEASVPTLGGAVMLRIPAGSGSGKRLRLKGRGLPASGKDAPPGDQYVEVAVQIPTPATDEQRQAYEQLKRAFE
ncbi:MAG: DnaJ domain-containing protein [Xanthomonadales bacterium]|nr:DnaJ domain-containing protein [Xanthomonadales bacterium]